MMEECPEMLYLIEFLHQTTTYSAIFYEKAELYLIEFLHQTTTSSSSSIRSTGCILLNFYIKPQPSTINAKSWESCILLNFYIKPQQACELFLRASVVSYWISTSNHNAGVAICSISVLYAVLSGREIECGTFVEVSLMCFFVFQRTKILFFRKIPTAAACPVLPVHSCPRSWECLHTVCLSQTEYS